MFSLKLIEAIAARDCHIREMLELKRIADKAGVPSRCNDILQGWTDEWLRDHPREGAILKERIKLEGVAK
jgi:hypothetical protein